MSCRSHRKLFACDFTRQLRHILALILPLHLPYLAFVCLPSFLTMFSTFESILEREKVSLSLLLLFNSSFGHHFGFRRPIFNLNNVDFLPSLTWVSFWYSDTSCVLCSSLLSVLDFMPAFLCLYLASVFSHSNFCFC